MPSVLVRATSPRDLIREGVAGPRRQLLTLGGIVALISPEIVEGFKRCVTHGERKEDWFTVRVGDHRMAGPNGFLRQKENEGLKVGDPIFEIHYTNNDLAGGVHRAHFLDELLKLIPASVSKLGKRLVDISTAVDGSQDAVLHFSDGTTAQRKYKK